MTETSETSNTTDAAERPAILRELAWRGMLHQETDGAAAALAAGPVAAYCGFDPTASSLHVGSLLPIMGLVHLQRYGHRPVALVGGGTGMIGDPSGRTAERQLITKEQVDANVAGLREQLGRFLAFEGDAAARLVDNGEWLLSLGAVDFMRDVGKHFPVNVMLAKESVRQRMETGISYTEFSYMLLQAYDFVQLYRRHGVTLQVGGSDQWGNITAGTELLRRMEGAAAHGVTFPLLTTAAGTKFGKSEAGPIWLDAARTSPYQFFQFWVNAPDADVGRYLRFFTLLEREEVEALETSAAARPQLREAQQALAVDVTTRVHGAPAARTAQEVSALLFGKGDPASLSPDALDALTREVPSTTVPPADGGHDVLDLFVAAGLAASKGAAKRLLEQGGLSVNGRKRTPDEKTVAADELLAGGRVLLKKGARDWAVVTIGE